MTNTSKTGKRTIPSAQQTSLIDRFVRWARRLVFGDLKKKEPPVEPETSWTGTLYVASRPYERARYTWKFVPAYTTNPINAIVFFYCDDIQNYKKLPPVKKKFASATHRMTVVVLTPGKHRELWSQDFELVDVQNTDQTAWIVSHMLSHLLLGNYYDQIEWEKRAQFFAERHKPQRKKPNRS